MSRLEIAEHLGSSIILMVIGIVLWDVLKRIGVWYDRLHHHNTGLPTYVIEPFEGEKDFYEPRAITRKEVIDSVYGLESNIVKKRDIESVECVMPDKTILLKASKQPLIGDEYYIDDCMTSYNRIFFHFAVISYISDLAYEIYGDIQYVPNELDAELFLNVSQVSFNGKCMNDES